MIAFSDRQNAQRMRRPVEVGGVIFHKSEWIDRGAAEGVTPTVFMVEQPPDSLLVPHFHRENQYQLFVEGGGTIGRSPLSPVTVHYAGAYTGYGPLLSGPDGVKYFTIRAAFDTGALTLDESRAEMARGPKRHATSNAIDLSSADDLRSRKQLAREAVIAPQDGMGAILFRLPPNARLPVESLGPSVGQFVFVLNGAVKAPHATLHAWDNFFVPDGEPCELAATAAGAEVVALHVPPRDAAYAEALTGVQAHLRRTGGHPSAPPSASAAAAVAR
ncbi:hypothetical protein [Ramlibacter sp.]|uniref:hypothetical protein n=1 Tax=Ramlibacter sp. TaxID=1917967 RepID=UPI003D14C7C6